MYVFKLYIYPHYLYIVTFRIVNKSIIVVLILQLVSSIVFARSVPTSSSFPDGMPYGGGKVNSSDLYASHQWTEYDKTITLQCSTLQEGINSIISNHNSWYEDRKWKFGCKQYVSSDTTVTCTESGYINRYDDLIDYMCGDNKYINKLYSVHSNHEDDRRWKVTCCSAENFATAYHRLTPRVNAYDGYMDFTVNSDEVMMGLHSINDNYYE